MLTFILCIAALVVGYIFYGKRVDKIFGSDDRETPAIALNDGVDFVPMKGWKIFLVQLLNIAGLGPIFGALNGALFGPVVYLWIVFGTIFAGGVHDYMCGMLSMRHKGASISEITGTYLGKVMLQVMRVFSVILLVMVGVVFSKGPAGLLALLTPEKLDATFWLWVIIIYYFIATFVPIDKVIGKIYPIFGICLIIMPSVLRVFCCSPMSFRCPSCGTTSITSILRTSTSGRSCSSPWPAAPSLASMPRSLP